MNRLACGAALLALGLAAGAARADEAAQSTAYRAPWYKRWFGIGPDAPKPAPVKPRDPAKEAARARADAEADLNRRQAVCDQLRNIADQTNNKELSARADDLERQAWDIYLKQTSNLPCSRLLPSQDERSLDRRLGTTTAAADAADKLMTPAITVPSRSAQASAVREIKP